MDKNWIKHRRWKPEYSQGVTEFLDYASANASQDGTISCPCIKCVNSCSLSREVVQLHLLNNGISPNYSNWYFYGEPVPETRPDISFNKPDEIHAPKNRAVPNTMHDMLYDMFRAHNQSEEYGDISNSQNCGEDHPTPEQPRNGLNEGAKKFFELLKDAKNPLYNGCKNMNKLETIVTLLHLKCVHKWSSTSFTAFLEVFRRTLPPDNGLLKDYYAAKKYIKDLGLGYEKIHACPRDCVLFWKENEALDECPKCKSSRWDIGKNGNEEDESVIVSKKKPAKVLRWFPLKPRLQRLYMFSETATHMRWHKEGRQDDGVMRHPADSMAWKSFDSRYSDFKLDPRNVRLGLATDGFNPFGNMSTTYSVWPVILIPYNLPPWLCMKQSSFILSLLIPGKTSPGQNIDVYLQPLVDELNSLWEEGVDTYDASKDETFRMHAALLWTIHDFPAYGDISGWSTKGSLACPACNYGTHSHWLKHGGKFCYMRTRRFLKKDHTFRKDKKSFDGTIEKETSPAPLTGSEVLLYTEKIGSSTQGKRKRDQGQDSSPWKKRSILFKLPYWEHILLRHNLDVMHIEKNVCDNILGTLLNIKGKTKDNMKAREDLKEMDIRKELHLERKGEGKYSIPPACFAMTAKEKDEFLKVLSDLKVPDEYSSNISRCIKQRKIMGLKSHDCHILMQQLLPIALRRSLPKKVVAPLIDLCCIFRELCSKSLTVPDLEKLEIRSAETLCHLEKIFPPSFFTVMVHLVVHLANEAKINGPVMYRWMYPIERYLFRLKSYVKNKAHPEGSIAEAYLAEECMVFCSRYLGSTEPHLTRSARTDDDSLGSTKNIVLDHKSWMQAHRYVLFNDDEIIPFRNIHRDSIRRQNRGSRLNDAALEKIHMEKFVDWFQSYVNESNGEFSDKIKWIARGPNTSCRSFRGYVSNGVKYRTKGYERTKKTQNSGVCVETEGNIWYYGTLEEIIELNYFDMSTYIMFRCNWVNINPNKGLLLDEFGFTLVNFSQLMHTGERLIDEPFILASQARQVFYVEDERHENWLVAVKTKPRDIFDMGEDQGDNSYCDNEPYTVNLQNLLDQGQDHVGWRRGDVEGEIIDKRLSTNISPLNPELSDESEYEADDDM